VPQPRWEPSPERAAATAMAAFCRHVREHHDASVVDYDRLHAWSVRDPGRFWETYVAWAGIALTGTWRQALSADPMPHVRWFEGASLNVAAALLGGDAVAGAGREALIGVDEAGRREALSWEQLRREVARVQAALAADGVAPGDRVVAFAANRIEAVVLFLACAASGAVFTSCSPDFGLEAAQARFAQVEPRLLVATPRYRYGGREHDVRARVRALAAALPSLRRLVWLPDGSGEVCDDAPGTPWSLWRANDATRVSAPPLPFDHPLAILFSSGTTGRPKAIVHRAGGVLLTHHKEHRLHCDIRAGDVVCYVTTLAWMMWNWLVSALAQGASIVLYDGSPLAPEPLALWRCLDREGVTFFGTGARYLHGLAAAGVRPRTELRRSALRTLASTGSPLAPTGFAYVYDHVCDDVHLASISGGTDIVGCFALGVPTLPVVDGELQRPGLGVDLAVFDPEGMPLEQGIGELVCRTPLPSMPLGFWGADGAERYHAAYFERYPGVWHHGDLVERTRGGGVVIHGRSDATLNPGGVRIGSAEIYRPLEAFADISEACAVPRRVAADEEVWLLVVLRAGVTLDDAFTQAIRARIRAAASPRHVPKRIVQVPALPQTRSGKAMELAVRQLVNGERVANRDVMADPSVVELLAQVLARHGVGAPSDESAPTH